VAAAQEAGEPHRPHLLGRVALGEDLGEVAALATAASISTATRIVSSRRPAAQSRRTGAGDHARQLAPRPCVLGGLCVVDREAHARDPLRAAGDGR
jgi:hypothetical protein